MPENLGELNSILNSGSLSYGKWGKIFENQLASYFNHKNVAVVNSFNSAILVLIASFNLKSGDEVIASPMSCLASNQPFAACNIIIRWADIDPMTGTLSPSDVKKKITNRTKLIFHNHHCGYPGYIDEIREIANQNGLLVIDDGIEAFGSEYKGRRIGNVGSDATVFSFQTVRMPNTIDGGAFIINNDKIFEKALRIRDYGINRSIFRDKFGEISKDCDISEHGYGATLNEVSSYIGFAQMNSIDKILNLHSENAKKWNEVLITDFPELIKVVSKDSVPNYWVYGILAKNKRKVIDDFRAKGYYASGVHLPNNYYSVFGEKVLLKGVEEFYAKFVALPCGWWFKK